MSNPVVELYSPERLEKLDRRRRIVKRLLWGLALAALAVCIVLTTQVNTRNIYRMLLACICVSVGAAWIIIYVGTYAVRDPGRELAYAKHLEEGERQSVTGKVTLQRLKVRIRSSVTLRKVLVETEQGPVNLSVHIDKTEQLRQAGEYLTLYTVHGYIVAYQKAEGGDGREIP